MRVTGIDHVVLRVRDLERARAFYMDVLGCVLERRQEEIGMVQLRAGAQLIDLVDITGKIGLKGGAAPGEEGRNMDHLCLTVADFDIDAAADHLRRHGVEPGETGERFGASGKATSLYLTDPDGNGLELRG